jgi:aspartyl-tRNA(Asn)/glutamyl-tRNA(Gln) amidotransferase subunit C
MLKCFNILGGAMSIDQETIKHVAHLARIELQEKELEKLSGELYAILNFIDKLKKLNVEQVKPASHILPISNVLREDTPRISLTTQQALENAPSVKGNFFTVPKIIE